MRSDRSAGVLGAARARAAAVMVMAIIDSVFALGPEPRSAARVGRGYTLILPCPSKSRKFADNAIDRIKVPLQFLGEQNQGGIAFTTVPTRLTVAPFEIELKLRFPMLVRQVSQTCFMSQQSVCGINLLESAQKELRERRYMPQRAWLQRARDDLPLLLEYPCVLHEAAGINKIVLLQT